jgi:hypothetical protein
VAASVVATEVPLEPIPGVRAEVATLIVQGVEGGGLHFAVAAGRPSPAAAAGRLELPLRIELAGHLPSGGADSDDRRLELYVYALDEEGAVVGHLAAAATVGAALDAAELEPLVELQPVLVSLRVLVYEPAGQRFGLQLF